MSRLERNIQKECHAYLKSKRDLWFLKVFGNGVQRAGVPDFIVCKDGLFYAFELKRDDEKATTTDRQAIELKKIQNANGKAYVIRSVEELINILE